MENSVLLEMLQDFAKTYGNDPPKGVYRNQYQVILGNGKLIAPEELNKEETDIVNKAFDKSKNDIEGQCYHNAQRLCNMDSSESINYVEGYHLTQWPIEHGWNSINGKWFDITFKKYGKDMTDLYYGVEFPNCYIQKLPNVIYDSIFFEIENLSKILDNEFNIEDYQ